MTRNPSVLVEPQPSDYLTVVLGVDAHRDRAQVSVAKAMARFLGELGIPAVTAGTQIGDVLYPKDHALVFGFNLFGDSFVEVAENENEPVIVTCAPDGTVTDFGSSKPQGDVPAVTRIEVRGLNEAVAQDCSWLLHKVFSRRPGFERQLHHDGQVRTDLIVRGSRPIDEPQLAEIDVGNRVLMVFRVVTSHSRL